MKTIKRKSLYKTKKTPSEIRKSYPSYDISKLPKLSASQMSGDIDELKRQGSTPAQGDDNINDDEVSDDYKLKLLPNLYN